MGEMSIAVELRDGKGKEFNRKLRAAGRVPGVVYGGGKGEPEQEIGQDDHRHR